MIINNLYKFVVNEILHNGHLQSLGAASVVYISSLFVLDVNASLDFLALVYLIFQFIFMFDRYRDIELDRLTNRQRTNHLRIYFKRIPLILAALASIIVVGLLYFSNVKSLLFALVIIILGFLYPIYFKGLTKKIFVFKNLYVSLVYAALVYFPLIYYSVNLENYNILFILFTFIFVESFINQASLDSKDVEVDKKEKLFTLPVLLGKNRSLNFLRGASLMLGILFVYLASIFRLNFVFMFLIIINIFVNQLFIHMIYENKKAGYVISAGKFFLWFFIVLTFRIFI